MLFISIELSLRFAAFLYVGHYVFFGEARKAVDPHALRILCMGESTTEGHVGIREPKQESYPARLEQMLRRRLAPTKVQVFNRGLGAVSTMEAHRLFQRNLQLCRPHITIIQLGNNDFGVSWLFWSETVVGQKVARLLNSFRTLRMLKLSIQLFVGFLRGEIGIRELSGQYYATQDTFSGKETFDLSDSQQAFYIGEMVRLVRSQGGHVILCNYFLSAANRFLPEIAAREAVPLCDLSEIYTQFERSGRALELVIPEDNWHPNAFGYSLIARKLYDMIFDLKLIPDQKPVG